jgi:hypothetical protein
MARRSQYDSIAALLSALLLAFILPQSAMSQSAPAQQQQTSNASSQHKPVPLAHLYWHFLVHQNHLDESAANETAQGRDGSWLRNHHQASLGFSEADYAVIRTSSARLTAEVKDIDAQAAAIRAAGPSATSAAQLKALYVQREAAINAEITYLKQALPPDKLAAFEAYITQFFSSKKVSVAPSAPTAVQQ